MEEFLFKNKVCIIFIIINYILHNIYFKKGYLLRGGVDIIVGTPGRIIDMCNRREIKLEKMKTVVLDEADLMLQMGFEEQISEIFDKIYEGREKKLQVCLFSATFPKWVKDVAHKIMRGNESKIIDLVKDLSNKTPSGVQHLAMHCVHHERTNSIADLSKIIYFNLFSSMLWRKK